MTADTHPGIERIAVCVSSHPLSERLVRTGAQLARGLSAEWYVVYVETPDRVAFSAAHSARLDHILRIAEDLGARVLSISGQSVPEAVIRFAREQGITRIVVGRPLRPRWLEFLNGSIVDEIIRSSGPADVYVISDERGPLGTGFIQALHPHHPWTRYAQGALLVGLVTLINIPIHFVIDPINLVMIYLLVVVAAAAFLGRGPSMLTSLLSALAFDFFFIDPRLSFTIADVQYLLTFVGMLAVSLVISNLSGIVSSQVEASRSREAQTSALYALGRELTVSIDLPAVLETVVHHIGQSLGREVVILLPEGSELAVKASTPGCVWSPDELETARWAFDYAQPAGRGSDTEPDAGGRYVPLITSKKVVGVLGVRPNQNQGYLNPDQRQMLEAYCSLAALAVERALLAEEAGQARLLSETEKLQTALLNSISHDLRTPLASITGAFSSLFEAEGGAGDHPVRMDRETRLELIETGWEEAERMNRLVGNLLDMTRLESGALRLNIIESDIEEVIGSALTRLRGRLGQHRLRTDIPAQRPMTPMDPVLIEQTLINLVDNAIKYSKPGSEISIEVRLNAGEMLVSVLDRGQGIPEDDLLRIFDRFYRIQRLEGTAGTGLGLSICKGIIEAHNGRIWAENRPGGGAAVRFSLPVEDKND